MRDRSQKPTIETGTYRHFKGGTYEVEGVVQDWSEGAEDKWMVLYRTELGALGVRNYDEFTGMVYREGKTHRRFEKLEEKNTPLE